MTFASPRQQLDPVLFARDPRRSRRSCAFCSGPIIPRVVGSDTKPEWAHEDPFDDYDRTLCGTDNYPHDRAAPAPEKERHRA